MKISLSILILIVSFVIISCSKSPDIIYINGKVYTLDNNNNIVEAIAVRDGKITDLGNTDDFKKKYENAELIDLKGKTVIPGFIDAEGSIIDFSRNLNFIDLSQVKSISEIKSLISGRIRDLPAGSWIGGFGWNELMMSEEDLMKMDKSILDSISPDVNIYLVNITSNTVWCNSKLLKTLQITELTPSPLGGEIEKDEKGKLTGLFYDSAVNLVKEKIPSLTREDIMNAVEKGTNELLRYGITGIKDKTVTMESINMFKELIDNNKFNTRLYAIISAGDDAFEYYLKNGPEENYSDKLSVRSVSIDYDGSIGLKAAYLSDKYLNSSDTSNYYTTAENIENYFTKSYENGFQFCVKTVGDKAVSTALSIIEKVIKEKGMKDHRTILEYVQFVKPDDMSKINKLKIIPSIRPEIDVIALQTAPDVLPVSSLKILANWNSILKSSSVITSGSNFPFNLINPIVQIYFLTNRKYLNTDTLVQGSEQALSVLDAVKSYTVWAAYSGFEDNIKGTIEISKYADFVILSDDIMNYDKSKLFNIKVEKTVFGGKILYEISK